MSNRLKVVLGMLVLVAGFLVFRIGLFVKDSANNGARVRGETITAKEENFLKKDSDSDGISDYDEAYYRTDPFKADTDGDGYLDGEEVTSDCSPILPSDDCNLNNGADQSSKNITEHFGNLLFGGLLSGNLKKDNSPSSNYTDILVNEALKTRALLLDLNEPNPQPPPDIYPQSDQEYLNALEDILLKYFLVNKNLKLPEPADSENFDFSPYIQDLGQFYKELSDIDPPQDWAQIHVKFLKFVLELKNYFLGLMEGEQDPLKSLFALSNTGSFLGQYDEILKEISEKVKTRDLKTKVFYE